MRRIAVILGLLLCFPLASLPQQHAPTLQMCRADAAVWGNAQAETDYFNAEAERVTYGTPNPSPIEKLPVTEVKSRMREMGECFEVDPSQQKVYVAVDTFYGSVQGDRWLEFILRHHLMKQFEREDAEGER